MFVFLFEGGGDFFDEVLSGVFFEVFFEGEVEQVAIG